MELLLFPNHHYYIYIHVLYHDYYNATPLGTWTGPTTPPPPIGVCLIKLRWLARRCARFSLSFECCACASCVAMAQNGSA